MSQIEGREVEMIIWTYGSDGSHMCAGGKRSMHVINMYHGDHDDDWVIVMENGKEISRHNVRYIASIEWAVKP